MPIALSENGQRYRVVYAEEVLAEGRRNPIFDACRALVARGITGRLEVWRKGSASADMQLDIAKGAALAIEESDKKSIRLRRWVPMRISRPRGEATAAISRAPVLSGTQPTKTAASDSTRRQDAPLPWEAR